MAGDVIEIRELDKAFQIKGKMVYAVQGLELSVKPGEFVALLGPSGCGKTTILRLIAGLERPSAGRVLKDGAEITDAGPDRGFVFQEYALFPWRNVLRNVEFGPEMKGVNSQTRREKAMEYIRLVGLEGFERAHPHELSGGMRQRVALARALANEPEIILMDEPFGSLDAQTRNIMQDELLRIWEATKKTVLFVTHSVDESVYLADRIIVLTARPGRVKNIVDVELPRPRDRAGNDFAKIRHSVLSELESEVKETLRLERER